MSNDSYISIYIYRAMHVPTLEVPDPEKALNASEILFALYDAHQKGGPEAAKTAWQIITQQQPEAANLVTIARNILHAESLKHLPPIQWLVEGMIPRVSFVELHGASGSGKSHLALLLAAKIAQHEPVIYVAAEGVSGYRMRVEAWKSAYQKDTPHLYFDTDALNLLDENEVNSFIEEARFLHPALIIFDTLHRCMPGGDENSAKDMGLVIKSCEGIKRELNTTVMAVHHTGKTGTSERGSSALRGACDSMIELTNTDGLISVESSKLKDGKPFAPMYMELKEFGDSVALMPTNRRATSKDGELTSNTRKILEMLSEDIYQSTGATYTRIKENTGVTNSTLDRALSKLKQQGLITQAKRGEPYKITKAGLAAIQR